MSVSDINVIYWQSHNQNPDGSGKFPCSKINTKFGSHFIYAFLGVDSNANVIIHNDDKKKLRDFVALKNNNPKVKFMFSVGGANAKSSFFSTIAADISLIKQLADGVLKVCEDYGFDGFDLDWEYPNYESPNGTKDITNFNQTCKVLYQKLKSNGKIFSIAVGASKWRVEQSYNIKGFINYVDFINLMAYDYCGFWGKEIKTGHNAPLNKIKEDVQYWIKSGAPRNKLVLGMATYGKSFKLKPVKISKLKPYEVGAPADGPGEKGEDTGEAGILSYKEIIRRLRDETNPRWVEDYDKDSEVPYAYKGNQWVSYDNCASIDAKGKFIKSEKLAGAMWWSIDLDDINTFTDSSLIENYARNDYLSINGEYKTNFSIASIDDFSPIYPKKNLNEIPLLYPQVYKETSENNIPVTNNPKPSVSNEEDKTWYETIRDGFKNFFN